VLDLTSNLILKLKIKRLVYLEILYQSKAKTNLSFKISMS